jgi:hypothetical protein
MDTKRFIVGALTAIGTIFLLNHLEDMICG